MGTRTVRSVLEHSTATGTDRMVLFALAEHANDATGTCWPGVELLAAEVRVQVRAVQYALKALVARGELAVEVHGAPVAGRRQYRPNLYRVLVGGARALTPGSASSGAQLSITTDELVVHDDASSGAPGRHPVVHGGAPKPEENNKEPLRPAPRLTDDPVKVRAHALTKLAFEQPIKPALRAGRKGGEFPAAMGIIERLLAAGHPASTIEGAIRAGVEVWTTAGLETAIAKAKRTMEAVSYDAPKVIYR